MRQIAFTIALLLVLAPTAYGRVTITLLAGNQNPDLIGKAIKEFEADHPDIKVDMVLEEWNTVDDKFTVMMASGMPPDVFINNSVYGWARYGYREFFSDLTPFIERDKKTLRWDQFFPAAIEQAKIGGKLYSMPGGPATGFATTYNANLLEEAGLAPPPTNWSDTSWTWDTMVAYAKKLTKVDDENKATQYGVDFWDADGPLLAAAYAFGGDWFDSESYRQGVVNQVTINQPANAQAYQAVADLRIRDQVRPGGPLGGVGGGINQFAAGYLGMWLETTLFRPAKNPPAAKFTWGIAPFPFARANDRNRISSWGGGGWAAIPTGAKNQEAAWTFLTWVTITERSDHPWLKEWMGGGMYRSNWLASIDEWYKLGLSSQSKTEVLEAMMGAVESAVALPRQTVAGGTEVWEVVNQQLVPALYGNVPIVQALESAQSISTTKIQEFKSKAGPK